MLTRKENTHDDAIWSCVWGRIRKKKDKDPDMDDGVVTGHDEEVDYIVTGGADDLVKLWSFEEKEIQLNHTLTGHSLGVASVAINSDGTSKQFF